MKRALLAAAALAWSATAIAAPPPDPWPLLHGAEPSTPPLDVLRPASCRAPEHTREVASSTLGGSRADQLAERQRLEATIAQGEDASTRGCAALASARMALALGRAPEAAAAATQSRREAESLGDVALIAAARFARAEADSLAGRSADALPVYESLASDSDPRLAAAARLRVAEAQAARGETEAALVAFRDLLGPDSPLLGVPLGPFALRAAEAAWTAGDAGEAARWVEQALGERMPTPFWIAATVRRADLLAAAGRSDESERQLAAVAAVEPNGPAALLVDLRRAERAVTAPRIDRAAVDAWLQPAFASGNPMLSAYAHTIAAAASLGDGRPAESFDTLAPLLAEPGTVARFDLGPRLDRVLAALLEDPEQCPEAIARIDAQRGAIVRLAGDGEVLVRLGDCYRRVGLADIALAVLRVVAQRFGAELASLPLARAAARAGAPEVAASAARDRIAAQAADADAWRLLLAEVDLQRGGTASAVELLAPLVDRVHGADRERVLVLLAEASATGAAPGAVVDALADALDALDDAAWRSGSELAEAALGTAHLLRRSGRIAHSDALYELASRHAERAATRAEASYWRGRLAKDPAQSRAHLADAVRADAGSWSLLARSRIALLDLGRRLVRSARG
jgi:tetratricopeptide (TPR) repeat protein